MRLSLVLKALAVFLAVGIVALVAAAKSIDPRQTRDSLASWLVASTGYQLDPATPWRLKMGLVPRLWADNVRLLPHGQVKRIEAELDLLPMLRRHIRITRLVISEPHLDGRLAGALGRVDVPPPDAWASVREIKIKNARWVRVPALGPHQTIALHRLLLRVLPGGARQLSLDAVGDIDGRSFTLDGQLGNPFLPSQRGWPVRVKGSYDGMVGLLDGRMPSLTTASTGAASLGGLDVRLSLQSDDAASAARLLGWDIPPLGAMKGSARFQGDWQHVAASDVELVAGRRDGWRLSAKGRVGQLFPLGGLEMLVQAEREGTAPQGMKIASLISGGGDDWRFQDLHVHLADLQSRGNLALALGGFRPRIDGSLAFDRLDLSAPLPITIMWGGLDGQVQMQAKHVQWGDLALEQLRGTLSLSPGLLRFHSAEAEGLGGHLKGELDINHARSPASLSVSLLADGLKAGAILQGKGDPLWADAALGVQLLAVSRGDSLADLRQNFSGQAVLSLTPGQAGAPFRCGAALLTLRGAQGDSSVLAVENGKSVHNGTVHLDLERRDWDMQLSAAGRNARSCRDVLASKLKL